MLATSTVPKSPIVVFTTNLPVLIIAVLTSPCKTLFGIVIKLDKFLTDQTYTIVATIGALTETKSFNVDINRPVITLVGDATTFVRVGSSIFGERF